MAQIILPNTYTDGLAFDADDHAQNLYDATGSGLYSELNGNLAAGGGGNLNAPWNVRAEHVQPNCLVKFFPHSNHRSVSLYNDAAPDANDMTYVQLGDTSAAFYIDYDPGLVLWQWQFFVHQFRPEHIVPAAQPVPSPEQPKILVKAFLDGTQIMATIRSLAKTALFDSGDGTGTVPGINHYTWEDLAAQWWSMQWLATGVTAGPHSISIRVSMEEPIGSEVWIDRNIGPLTKLTGAGNDRTGYSHRLYSRITFGVRSAVGIPMWAP